MKKRSRRLRKFLLVACCTLTLVAVSVGATLAYLTDTEAVTNVFTVGNVDITLDEALVDANGDEITGDGANRVLQNTYHLVPGESYDKDPTIHVKANSENCWIFVKVENGIQDIEAAGTTTIAAQMAAKGWHQLMNGKEPVKNVYYQSHTQQDTDKDYIVFESFTLDGDKLRNGTGTDTDAVKYIGNYANATITVTAYAVQQAGFENPYGAWDAGTKQTWTKYEPANP